MSDLSIIIVTYNPGDLIVACLASVEAASAGLDVEIIVVDNASDDGTVDRLHERFKRVRTIANPDNRGFAAACNQGLAVAGGRFLLLLNPDATLSPEALSSMMGFMEAHPQSGIIGPRIYDSQGRVALSAYPPFEPAMIVWQYLGLDRLFPYIVFGHYRRQCEQADKPFKVEWVQGSCLMFRREVYEAIGGLDESFFLFCEEPDLCERARAHGWDVTVVPQARITHLASSTVSRYTAARVRHYHLSPLIYFRKRGRPGAVLILKLGFTLELVWKLVLRLAQMAVGRREFAVHVKTYWSVFVETWLF